MNELEYILANKRASASALTDPHAMYGARDELASHKVNKTKYSFSIYHIIQKKNKIYIN